MAKRDITLFVEVSPLLGFLAQALTTPLILVSLLSLFSLYFKTHETQNAALISYLNSAHIILRLASEFIPLLAVSFALGVLTYFCFLLRKHFNVNLRDKAFLVWLTIPPFTFLFLKAF